MTPFSFCLITCFLGFCAGDAVFTSPSPMIAHVGGSVNMSCVTDSPWIWMDFLKNKTYRFPVWGWVRKTQPDGSESFSNEIIEYRNITRKIVRASFVRYDEIVTRDPRVSVSFSPITIGQRSKTLWRVYISNVTKSDAGDYSCVEQIFYPTFTTLTSNSTAFATLRVLR